MLHGIDQRDYIVLLDVDVLDGLGEEFFLRCHSQSMISTKPAYLQGNC
jgi:hypothetical protein